MAGIHLTRSGTWCVRWREGGKTKSKSFKVEAEANAFKEEKDALKEESRKRKFEEKREQRAEKRRKGVGRNGNNNLVETLGIILLAGYINGLTRVTDGAHNLLRRVADGAHADLFISFLNDVLRGYGIQVKVCTTRGKDGQANFKKVNHYEDLIVICVLLDEKRVWVFHGKDLTHLSGLGIGRKSKYNKNKVPLDQLQTRLQEMSTKYTPNTLEYFNRDLPPRHLVEYITHQNWLKATGAELEEKGLDHVENGVVDCIQIINEQRVARQEKVLYKQDNAFYAHLSKNAGNVDGKRSKQNYEKGDNDVYCLFVNKYGESWSHGDDREAILSATLIGWFEFPEEVLIEKKYIETESQAGRLALNCYLPEEVAISVGFPLPERKCPSLWTRDYFVPV